MIKSETNNQNTDNQEINNSASRNSEGEGNCGNGKSQVNMADQDSSLDDNTAGMAGQGSDEWKDKYLRLSAEFDNYRKRTLKEKMDLITFGGEDIIKDLLPVLDDMDRATHVMQNTTDIESVRTGIELISHKLKEVLKTKGVKEIEALGNDLDTDLHEAVAKTPAPQDESKGKIVDVVQKGYTLKDKVVRHAKVVVGE